jgi:hypothetical protein
LRLLYAESISRRRRASLGITTCSKHTYPVRSYNVLLLISKSWKLHIPISHHHPQHHTGHDVRNMTSNISPRTSRAFFLVRQDSFNPTSRHPVSISHRTLTPSRRTITPPSPSTRPPYQPPHQPHYHIPHPHTANNSSRPHSLSLRWRHPGITESTRKMRRRSREATL